MSSTPPPPQPPENTRFVKELQTKETKSRDEFLGGLLLDGNLAKDHIALRSNSSTNGNVKGNAGKIGSSPSEMHTQLSMNLWKRVNAGYLVPARPPIGVSQSTYTYDKTQIEKKSFEFHRKRDFYSEYNEAAARFKLVHGNKKPLSRKKESGKEGKDKMSNDSLHATGSEGKTSQQHEEQSIAPPSVTDTTNNNTNNDNSNSNNNNKNSNTIDTNSQQQDPGRAA